MGLLYGDGKLTGSLASGAHAFWIYGPVVKVDVMDLRSYLTPSRSGTLC